MIAGEAVMGIVARVKATAVVGVGALGILAGTTVVALADGYGPPVAYGPVPFIAPAYNWTGVYFGGSIGGGWQNLDWRYINPATGGKFSANDGDGVGGVHIGAQYQWGNIVAGAEVGGLWRFNDDFSSKRNCVTGTSDSCQARFRDGVLTVGPRLGWAANNWLFYGTGGYALGTVASRVVESDRVVFDTTSKDENGWFAGGGIEYAIAKNVILGVEYQHIDLGTTFHPSSADGFAPGPNGRDIGASEDIVRARLSFKFGGDCCAPPPPPPPPLK
jgi:outer membrane immunogenic protein